MYNAVIEVPKGEAESRYALRQPLLLKLPAHLNGQRAELSARNISQTGFLAGTQAPVQLGDRLTLDMPELGAREAQVVWKSGAYLGCNFLEPLPRSAVSAAMLASAILPKPVVTATAAPLETRIEPAGGPILRADDRLSPRTRLFILLACATLPWMSIAGIVSLV
jgi:hypothetical protein